MTGKTITLQALKLTGRERWKQIVEWHDQYGASFREIGLALGLTKQRVHAIYHSQNWLTYADMMRDKHKENQ